MWTYFYHRTIKHLGDTAHHLVPQKELSRLAHPFYHQLARGGEGFMEVGKNVYYTVNHLCHMVLALKPFGCMPSTQSDGVQSRVVNKYKDMIFLPIETSGEGEVNAHSRVQMALAEAKAKARAEFQSVLDRTGRSLEELRAGVEAQTPAVTSNGGPLSGEKLTLEEIFLRLNDLNQKSASNRSRRESGLGAQRLLLFRCRRAWRPAPRP